MTVRCINFAYFPIRINVMPADPEINALFRAASMTYIQPFKLAADLGRLSEEAALRNLALAYSEGVIAGSPDDVYIDYTPPQWATWLLENPAEFDQLRGICEVTANFTDEDPNVPQPGHSG